jgi:hypothetical protein
VAKTKTIKTKKVKKVKNGRVNTGGIKPVPGTRRQTRPTGLRYRPRKKQQPIITRPTR